MFNLIILICVWNRLVFFVFGLIFNFEVFVLDFNNKLVNNCDDNDGSNYF